MRVSVKVGSHKVYVEITKTTTSKQLMRRALDECKISIKSVVSSANAHSLFKPEVSSYYSMFERALGVEREMSPDENIFEIWLRWSLNNSQRIEFLVRMNSGVKAFQKRLMDNPGQVYKIYRAKYMSVDVAEPARASRMVASKVQKVHKAARATSKGGVKRTGKTAKPAFLLNCVTGYQSVSSSQECLINLI
jgi:hypothetical protein